MYVFVFFFIKMWIVKSNISISNILYIFWLLYGILVFIIKYIDKFLFVLFLFEIWEDYVEIIYWLRYSVVFLIFYKNSFEYLNFVFNV